MRVGHPRRARNELIAPGRAATPRLIRHAHGRSRPERAVRAPPRNPPEGGDQPDVPYSVRELRSPGRLEVTQQVEPSAVIGAAVEPAQRHHAERFAIPAEGGRVRRLDR
jgi:hypothetical protein